MLHNMTQAALSLKYTKNISAHMHTAGTALQQFVNELLDYLPCSYSPQLHQR